MNAVLWAHGESFRPQWREQELAWIRRYQAALGAGGIAATPAGSTLAALPPANLVQIFGPGHYETLPWLGEDFERIVLSPFPFSARDVEVTTPQTTWRDKLLFGWRFFVQGRRPRPALESVAAFFLPEWSRPLARNFPAHRTLFLPEDPAAAAALVLAWAERSAR